MSGVITDYIKDNYAIIFQGDKVKNYEDVEEFIIAEEHQDEQCHKVNNCFIKLFPKAALLCEGHISLERIPNSFFNNLHHNNAVHFGWDLEESVKLKKEQEQAAIVQLLKDTSKKGKIIREAIQKCREIVKTLDDHPELPEEIKMRYIKMLNSYEDMVQSSMNFALLSNEKLLEINPSRMASMIKTLDVFEGLRTLEKIALLFKKTINPDFSFPVSILMAGQFHTMHVPKAKFCQDPRASVEALHQRVKDRNSMILCPKHLYSL